MMSDLKPCPFCGCNAGVLEREQLNGPILYKIVCNSKKCRGHDSAGNVGSWMENGWRESREEAAELWNRRSERACELELDEYENVIRCTSCGHEECNPCSNDCMYGNAKYKWKYCPNCGARVVSEYGDR